MPHRRDNDDFFPFPASTGPRPTQGGVKARTQRGAFAASWHGKRFLSALEALDPGARLARGRTYARKGQVVSIRILEGQVQAQVQGSQPRPYRVAISLPRVPHTVTAKVARRVAQDAAVAAALLRGTVPPELEDAFEAEGASLFPARSGELDTDCSCPDWSNPCKHIAAVYYLIAEELDRDPFLLLTLRGVDRSAFLPRTPTADAPCQEGSVPRPYGTPEAPPLDPTAFWEDPRRSDGARTVTPPVFSLPTVTAPLVRRLGSPPFWQAEASLEDRAGAILDRAADRWLSLRLPEDVVEDGVLDDLGAEEEPEGENTTLRTGQRLPASALDEHDLDVPASPGDR